MQQQTLDTPRIKDVPDNAGNGLLMLLGPALVALVFTTLLALLAGLAGWHAQEMLLIAAATGGLALAGTVLATFLLYRQAARHSDANRALTLAQSRVSGILESAMDAIITIDEEQRIVLFNAAAEQVFGCPRLEAIGAPLERFIPARFRGGHAAHVRGFGATNTTTRRMGAQRIVTGLRGNGEEFPIDASISQISEGGKKFYTVILRDVTERVRATEALSRSREELRDFAAAAGSVREQEKSRIARELHDELGQSLTALKMDMNWMAERLPAGDTALTGKLAAMQDMLGHTVASTRRISADLRPLMLDDLGLLPAVEWLVQNFTERSGIPCELNLTAPDLDLQEPYATAVFRILQESLTNVARHAQAAMVEVTLGRAADTITLTVEDDGQGLRVDEPRKPNSFGLMGIRERAYLLDGEAWIENRDSGGTRVRVRVPLARGSAPHEENA